MKSPRKGSVPRSIRCEPDLWQGAALAARGYERIRRFGGAMLGMFTGIPPGPGWVQFLLYHWVLDDQRAAFEQQLAYLRRYADFLSLDDALAALRSGSRIGGRHFCVTFDDGFRNVFTNAVPILKAWEIPAAFFVPTQYIGLDLVQDWKQIAPFYEQSWSRFTGAFEFLTWEHCRQMAAAGFVLGSHTHSHRRLTELTPEESRQELVISKELIEQQLARPCRHFCCPWGKAHRDYDPEVHPRLARSLGYESFLTAQAGLSVSGDSTFSIRRTSCVSDFRPAMLRYSLFSPLATRKGRVFPAAHKPVVQGTTPHDQSAKPAEPRIEVAEPEPVSVGKFPYPFQAAFTVASDIDSASLARFRAVHALFCGHGVIRPDSPDWKTLGFDARTSASRPDPGGVAALGLDFADSFFLVGDRTTFGMYRHRPEEADFPSDHQDGQNCKEFIWEGLKSGQIDSFHAFLHYTRAQLAPLLREFYERCEQEQVPRPRVWINHSLAVTPTGLCPRRLQSSAARRLIRLTGRKLVGPLFGRQPQPLRHAFARYQGAEPGSPHYVNDLLAENGVRYVWLNCDDLHRNRMALPEHSLNGRASILQPVTMDDGVRYYRFERCYGKPEDRPGGEAYLRDSAEGFDASVLINEANLETLCRTGGTCILYGHWTHPRSFPIPGATVSRFELLRRWRDAGRIWVTSTARLLEWTRRRAFLSVVTRREGQRRIIELDAVEDPVFGRETVTPSDLHGLCLHLPAESPEVAVSVGGHLLDASQVGRSGNLCWLEARGRAKREPRPVEYTRV